MESEEGQGSEASLTSEVETGSVPAGEADSLAEHTQRWLQEYEAERLAVLDQVARGELEALLERLMDDEEDKRYDMARHIARGGRPVIPRAMELVEDVRPRMREMACYILGQVGYPDPESPVWLIRYPEGVPALTGRLEGDPEPDVRAAAAAALGHQAVTATLPILCRAASDPDSGVRFDVACALGSFYEDAWEDQEARGHRSDVIAALLRLMDDEDDDIRDWATFGIHQGRHDTPETRARLWQALDDPCPDVRGEAAVGLAIFGDRSLIPRLDQLLREDPALPSHFFEAAEELGDPCLLPAVLVGAERWREDMEEGDELHYVISSAIEGLEKAATGPGDDGEYRSGAESNSGDESLSRQSGQAQS